MRVGASFIRMELEVINLDPEIEDTPTKSLFSNRRCKSSPAIKKPAHVGLAWSIWFAASCAICHFAITHSVSHCRLVDDIQRDRRRDLDAAKAQGKDSASSIVLSSDTGGHVCRYCLAPTPHEAHVLGYEIRRMINFLMIWCRWRGRRRCGK